MRTVVEARAPKPIWLEQVGAHWHEVLGDEAVCSVATLDGARVADAAWFPDAFLDASGFVGVGVGVNVAAVAFELPKV